MTQVKGESVATAIAALEAYRGTKGRWEEMGVNRDGNHCRQWHPNEAHIATVDAAIADLAAQQTDSAAVGEWVPVEHEFTINKLATWNDAIEDGGDTPDWWIRIDDIATPLPDDVRLCKRVAAPQWTSEEAEEWRVEAVHFRDRCIEYEHRIRELEQAAAQAGE